jgi:hypothetical protein
LKIIFQREFWLNLAGAGIVAVVAATPILMSGVMNRGFEIAKQSLAEPLAMLAFGAVMLAGGWRGIAKLGGAMKIAASALVVFLLLAVISTALSENPEVAIFGGYYRREGLLAWCVYGAFFFAVLGWARCKNNIVSFLDLLLLASAIPAAYALQQRLDLDFYPLGVRDFARPGAMLGSPVFLAAYLGLLLPITAARCWQARRTGCELVLWLTVAALQACGLLVTQSRGPLLAAIMGLLMLACCAGARAGARRIFVAAIVLVVVAAASVTVINVLPDARQWAQGVPVAGRLVFNPERDAGITTQLAARSAGARLAIWGAGVETFAAASLADKLLGYGPESAYMHYFSHMPAAVMRLVGYGAYATYDRMHADILDVVLNFGLLAWFAYSLFFGAVMYAAARSLWGLSGGAPVCIFLALSGAGGMLSAVAAVWAGLPSAAVPALGVGVGAGWVMFMAGCAWRALKRGLPRMPESQRGRWILLAALSSALCVFWADAQINIPVLTTRIMSFAIAALILVVAEALRSPAEVAETESASAKNLWAWGIACALVATVASCLPLSSIDAGAGVQTAHGLRRALPGLACLIVAALAAWTAAQRGATVSRGVAHAWLAIMIGLPLFYAAVHVSLSAGAHALSGLERVTAISIACVAAPVFIFCMCSAYAVLASRGSALTANALTLSPAARGSMAIVVAAALSVAALEWRVVRADVASSLAQQLSAKQPQLAEQLVEEAIRGMPYERYYRRQLVFDLLGTVVAEIRRRGDEPHRIPALMRNLAAAETAARTAALLFPRDPWVVVALANVLQVKALRVLRPLDPAGGARAAEEAAQLFARTHRMFPSEPLLLRNWAQLLSDQGRLDDAYRLLDTMEQLIPHDPEPYAARLDISRQAADKAAISDTLSRARRALAPELFAPLLTVANEQQN